MVKSSNTWGPEAARVLIVGAGPTGLTLANSLVAHGIAVTIVDQKSGPSRDSKALALNCASLYGLELLGLANAVGARGCQLKRVNLLWQGRRFSAVDLKHLDFHIQYVVTQAQAQTEFELVRALEESDCASARAPRVEWHTEVLEVRDLGEQGVEALIRRPERGLCTERFAYVVGCDGKNSVVRRAMGSTFTGHDYPMYFVVGDYELGWDAPRDQGFYYVYEDTFVILLPIGDNAWRVVVKHDGTMPSGQAESQEITDVVDKLLGPGLFRGAPRWISRAPFYLRLSDRLRAGRLLLAGDAAHLYSPIGGTGMNTGMQDALNLGWKLARCLKGQAHERLLDTYELERLTIIRMTAAATDRSTRLITRMDKDLAAVAPMLPKVSNRFAFRTLLPLMHSGLGVSCAPALQARGAPVRGSRRAGELCLGLLELDAARGLTRGDTREPAPLHAIMNVSAAADIAARAQELRALARRYPDVLRAVLLVPADASLYGLQSDAELAVVRATRQLVKRLGAGTDALLLVQPDGVVGFSGSTSEVAALSELLDTWLVARADASLAPRAHATREATL